MIIMPKIKAEVKMQVLIANLNLRQKVEKEMIQIMRDIK
jgi:hypothetical protein